MWLGGLLSLAGLTLRGAAATVLRKCVELAATGPYRRIRHPLYVGSFLIGVGAVFAAGGWPWAAVFSAFFVGVYLAVVRVEERGLRERFGSEYEAYRHSVPALVPRVPATRGRVDSGDGVPVSGVSKRPPVSELLLRYRENREWEAALGTACIFAYLVARCVWG